MAPSSSQNPCMEFKWAQQCWSLLLLACSSVVGVAFPGYMSFKSLETFDPSDEKQWLTYWVIFAILETIEVFGGFILLWYADSLDVLHPGATCAEGHVTQVLQVAQSSRSRATL